MSSQNGIIYQNPVFACPQMAKKVSADENCQPAGWANENDRRISLYEFLLPFQSDNPVILGWVQRHGMMSQGYCWRWLRPLVGCLVTEIRTISGQITALANLFIVRKPSLLPAISKGSMNGIPAHTRTKSTRKNTATSRWSRLHTW